VKTLILSLAIGYVGFLVSCRHQSWCHGDTTFLVSQRDHLGVIQTPLWCHGDTTLVSHRHQPPPLLSIFTRFYTRFYSRFSSTNISTGERVRYLLSLSQFESQSLSLSLIRKVHSLSCPIEEIYLFTMPYRQRSRDPPPSPQSPPPPSRVCGGVLPTQDAVRLIVQVGKRNRGEENAGGDAQPHFEAQGED
jgi:hypothetical protein